MSLSSPHRTTGEMVTASIWNTDLIDPINSLAVAADGLTWQGRIASNPTATAGLNASYNAISFSPVINKFAGGGTHPSFVGVLVDPPIIGSSAATVSTAASLLISGAPTGAITNYALFVGGGTASMFQGPITYSTDVNMGISFSDTRVTGLLAGSVNAYFGPNSGNFLLRVQTDAPLLLGSNNQDLLWIRKDNVTINLGGSDVEYLTLQSTDVGHGFTSDTATATFGAFRKCGGNDGGLSIQGYTEQTTAMSFAAQATAGDTGKAAGSNAAILMVANKLSGSTAGAMGANENLLVLRNNTANRFIFDSDGDLLYHSSLAAFDAYDDVALARSLDLELGGPELIDSAFDKFVQYNRSDLERAGIVTPDGFVSLPKHSRLLNGAVWQLFVQLQSMKDRIAQLEAA